MGPYPLAYHPLLFIWLGIGKLQGHAAHAVRLRADRFPRRPAATVPAVHGMPRFRSAETKADLHQHHPALALREILTGIRIAFGVSLRRCGGGADRGAVGPRLHDHVGRKFPRNTASIRRAVRHRRFAFSLSAGMRWLERRLCPVRASFDLRISLRRISHQEGNPMSSKRPPDLYWYLPTHGDGPYLGTEERHRPATIGYLGEIARAADRLGFKGVLLPTGTRCEDAWIVAAALIPQTRRLRFLVALRPGSGTPALFARHAAALDRISDGRVLVNVVTGADPADLAGDGNTLSHDERYAQTDEFLTIWRRILSGQAADFNGKYLSAHGTDISFPPIQKPHPPLWFGGSSDAGIEVAARHIDVYLSWGEPLEQVKEKFDRVRARAAAQGRSVRFGLRINLIVRETEEEAWAAADRLISRVTDDLIAEAQHQFTSVSESVGQKRISALHQGRRGTGW